MIFSGKPKPVDKDILYWQENIFKEMRKVVNSYLEM